jgi:hypothetical protein
MIPIEGKKRLGFDVDLGTRYFRIPADKWEVLKITTDALLVARKGQAQARTLACLVGTVI